MLPKPSPPESPPPRPSSFSSDLSCDLHASSCANPFSNPHAQVRNAVAATSSEGCISSFARSSFLILLHHLVTRQAAQSSSPSSRVQRAPAERVGPQRLTRRHTPPDGRSDGPWPRNPSGRCRVVKRPFSEVNSPPPLPARHPRAARVSAQSKYECPWLLAQGRGLACRCADGLFACEAAVASTAPRLYTVLSAASLCAGFATPPQAFVSRVSARTDLRALRPVSRYRRHPLRMIPRSTTSHSRSASAP